MKKITMLLCTLLCIHAAYAQSFIPPSLPEVTYPTIPMNVVARTLHSSCNSFGNVNGSNLYVYSWSALQPINGGFAFRRNSTSNTLISQGYQVYTDVSDLEVGLIMNGATVYIVASYYKYNTGHFVDLWQWNVAAGTIGLAGSVQLSATTTYARISLDVHKLYGAAVTWQVGNDIFVKVVNTSTGTLQMSNNLQIANGAIPAVAFGHFGDLRVRVAFVDPANGNIRVISGKFNDLLLNTVSMGTDYLQTGVMAGLVSQINNNPQASSWLNIDAPDDNPPGFDVWSYVYMAPSGDIMSVSKYATGIPALMNLSGNIKGWHPTIAYSANAQTVHYGWYTDFNASPQPGYVAVERGLSGSYVTPPNTYKVVANTTSYSGTPALSFSRQNDMNSTMFVIYPMYVVTGYEMRFKLVPWTATTFRHEVPGTELGLTAATTVSVSPNPFTHTLRLNGNPNDSYTLHVSDISGRRIYTKSGTLSDINSGLQEAAGPMKPGIYFFDILNETTSIRQSLKTVKQ